MLGRSEIIALYLSVIKKTWYIVVYWIKWMIKRHFTVCTFLIVQRCIYVWRAAFNNLSTLNTEAFSLVFTKFGSWNGELTFVKIMNKARKKIEDTHTRIARHFSRKITEKCQVLHKCLICAFSNNTSSAQYCSTYTHIQHIKMLAHK